MPKAGGSCCPGGKLHELGRPGPNNLSCCSGRVSSLLLLTLLSAPPLLPLLGVTDHRRDLPSKSANQAWGADLVARRSTGRSSWGIESTLEIHAASKEGTPVSVPSEVAGLMQAEGLAKSLRRAAANVVTSLDAYPTQHRQSSLGPLETQLEQST